MGRILSFDLLTGEMDTFTVYAWWFAYAIIAAVAYYIYLTWTLDYWAKRGVPFLKPKLFFGSLKDNILGRKTLGQCYQDCYNALKGHKFGGIFKIRQPVLLLRDPEVIKTIYVKEFTSFQDNDFHSNVDIDPLFGRNPFVLKGMIWKEARNKLSPAFTNVKLKPIFPLIEEVCSDLVEHLRESSKMGSLTEAKQLATMFTADAVSLCAYGLRQNSFRNPDSDFRKFGRKFLEPSLRKGIEQGFVILAPKLADFFRFKFTPSEVISFFRKMAKETVQYRAENNVVRNDFLQLLIQLKEKAAEANNSKDKSIPWHRKFTDDDIAAHALTFFTDGYETSSTALSCLLHNLAINQDAQKRLREEVDEVLKANNGKLTLETIQGMEYLDMALKESLRMYPVLPYMSRICTKPFQLTLDDGKPLTIEVGTPAITPVLGIHHDPEYYPEPHKFIPERFSEENKELRPKYTHFPFGEGPRICLGMRFAQAQIKACVTNIISEFEIKPTEKTPEKLTPVPVVFMFAPQEDIWLDFVRRTDK